MTPLTVAMINERNSQFWHQEAILMKERMADPAVLQVAVMYVKSESSRGVALRDQQSFEQHLADAQRASEIVLRELARKGGNAPKGDALQELIEEMVSKDLTIHQTQLLHMLKGAAGAGVVTSIDKPSDLLAGDPPCIHFVDDGGRPRTASVGGLKDRLSRAKRKIKNSL